MLRGKDGVVHSTDDYFMVDGRYLFDPTRLAEFHARNFWAFCASILRGVPIVVCDNTNARRVDFIHYVLAARRAGYEVKVIQLPHPHPRVAVWRSQHGVPLHTIQNMMARWEP